MALTHFPIKDSGYQLNMGLQALKADPWLEVDANYNTETSLKWDLIRNSRDKVFACVAGTEEAQLEILNRTRNELATQYPDLIFLPPIDDKSPLVQAASIVQEDLVLMRPKDDQYILAAACVCFPSGWNLLDKIGKGMHNIHVPVPGLNEAIGDSIDRFFGNLRSGKKVQRFNWGIFDDATLFQPEWWRKEQAEQDGISANTIGNRLFFRVEKQTLQRLSNNLDTLFTIRIFNTPLWEIKQDAEKAAQLHHALKTMPDAMRRYKSVSRYENMIFEYLES